MKKFFKKFALYTFVTLLSLEVLCRVFVDNYYFNTLDLYKAERPTDCIFIGSSRVPATIDESVFSKNNIHCTVAGRGYMTGGIHLTALQHSVRQNPDYLRNVNVFIEYPEFMVFPQESSRFQYQVYEPGAVTNDAAMPHLILPYLNWSSLSRFMTESPNSTAVKMKLFFLYCSSAYRCILFLQEKQPVNYVLKKIFDRETKQKEQLASEGGIKNKDFSRARKKAIDVARMDSIEFAKSSTVTSAELDKSILAEIYTTVKNNGGRLYLYKVPMHTVQKNATLSERAAGNKHTFEQWLQKNNIPVISIDKFRFTDNDFPDTWHLSVGRREEFSSMLVAELFQQHIVSPGKNAMHQAAYRYPAAARE